MTNIRWMAGAAMAVLLATVATGSVPALAQEGMRPLGSVTYRVEPAPPQRGVFDLRPEDRRLRSVRFRVDRGAADIRSVRLIYRDGRSERANIDEQLEQGETSAAFRLPGNGPLRTIEVLYVPQGETRITLLGQGRPPVEEPPPMPVARWQDLGCKSVGFLVDKDTIPVDSPDRFTSLRLRSQGFDIEVMQMSVRFGNGATDTYDIRSVIPSGTATRPIDLRGDARRIDAIQLLYRTRGVVIGAKTKLCVEGRTERPAEE